MIDRLPGGGPAPDGGDDGLTFAAQNLSRTRPAQPPPGTDDVTFEAAPRPGEVPSPRARPAPAPPPPAGDGFVIRDPAGAAPAAPVDALVVGTAPEAAQRPSGFQVITSSSPRTAPRRDAELPWTVRDPAPPPPPSRRGWSARPGTSVERAAQDTMRRLREDAVHVSWKAAWIAVTSADRHLFKRRSW